MCNRHLGMIFAILITLASLTSFGLGHASQVREQPQMTVTEMIRYWGYPVEEHTVVTEDNYILTMHRIPYGKNSSLGEPRTPVFMGHCLLCSSAIFSFGPPEIEIAYLLADSGYDVWMGNTRGNTWSKKHNYLDTCSNCSKFWDFNWDTTGRNDYSAEIDYVLSHTGYDDLIFVGYSMGTTQYFVLLSLKPEYNSKIRAGFLMGPSSFDVNSSTPTVDWEEIEDMLGKYEFLPSTDFFHYLAHEVCDDEHPITEILCENAFFALLGFSPDKLNSSMISFYLDHLPAGASTQTLVHYAQQAMNPGRFRRFDYGTERNMEEYGQATPPDYDLSLVTAPTALFIGQDDGLASVEDNELLASKLPNVIWHEVITHKDGFYHTDFFGAIQRKTLVYDHMLELMENYK